MKKTILSIVAISLLLTGCKSTEEKAINKTIEAKIESDKKITFENLKSEDLILSQENSESFITCMQDFERPIAGIKRGGEELNKVLADIEMIGKLQANQKSFELFKTATKMSKEGTLSDKEFSRELRKFDYLIKDKISKEMHFILFEGEVKKAKNGAEYEAATITNALHSYLFKKLEKIYPKETKECLLETTHIDPIIEVVEILVSDDETRAIAKVKRASDISNNIELDKKEGIWIITKS